MCVHARLCVCKYVVFLCVHAHIDVCVRVCVRAHAHVRAPFMHVCTSLSSYTGDFECMCYNRHLERTCSTAQPCLQCICVSTGTVASGARRGTGRCTATIAGKGTHAQTSFTPTSTENTLRTDSSCRVIVIHVVVIRMVHPAVSSSFPFMSSSSGWFTLPCHRHFLSCHRHQDGSPQLLL